MPAKTPPSALEKALRLLSVRAYSASELTARLLRGGYMREEAENAVRECAARRYIDDELLAEDCATLWQNRGHGVRSIRCKLRQRGVPREIAAAVLAESAEHEAEAAVLAIDAKMPSLLREHDLRKRRAKALRFLAARGFSGEALRVAMKRLDAVGESETQEE